MHVTAELRWFCNSRHDELKNWFCRADAHDFEAGGGLVRVDSYLRDSRQVELGLKLRGGKKFVEVKGLVCQAFDACNVIPFLGEIEVWSKWTSNSLELDLSKTITTEKRRWMRKFDTTGDAPIEFRLNEKEAPIELNSYPARGCSFELTEVRFMDSSTKEVLPNSQDWWTLSFESWGHLDSIKTSLCQVAAVMASRKPPAFDASYQASYPSFLSQHAPEALLSGSNRT